MSTTLTHGEIKDVIRPYRAADTIIRKLKKKGLIREVTFHRYTITPLGLESDDIFINEIKEIHWVKFDRKRIIITTWASIITSIISLIVSIIALCKS